MTYAVKEIFYTLQGEGAQAGRPAVVLRVAGCNLWSGLERDRASAVCKFCDTDFVGTDGQGGGKGFGNGTLDRDFGALLLGGGAENTYEFSVGELIFQPGQGFDSPAP